MRSAPPLAKVAWDAKLHILKNALGTHSAVSRVQGGQLKAKREIRIAALFKEAPADFLRMIVVHELAHLKEAEQQIEPPRLTAELGARRLTFRLHQQTGDDEPPGHREAVEDALHVGSGTGDLLFRLKRPADEFAGMEVLPYFALGAGLKWMNGADDLELGEPAGGMDGPRDPAAGARARRRRMEPDGRAHPRRLRPRPLRRTGGPDAGRARGT